MSNNQNDLVRCAMEKIRRDEKFKPDCCFIIPAGPTGATGATGPTARFNNSSNKFIYNFKQIYFKNKNKQLNELAYFYIYYLFFICCSSIKAIG